MKPFYPMATLLALATSGTAVAQIRDAQLVRDPAASKLTLSWQAEHPVDVYEAVRADTPLAQARLLSRADKDGRHVLNAPDTRRRYFLLVDTQDREQVEVAEREVPLAQSSNFRDLGGYPAAGGQHVRWGLIYRSGGQAMLTPADVEAVKSLGLAQLVDLRSSEERVMAPTRISGVPYAAVGYSMSELLRGSQAGKSGQMQNGADIYRNFPELLAPQLRLVFDSLLRQRAPLVYNCSAGQDRTGFVSALVLTALGVDRETVIADYNLSTQLRRPQFELPPLDPAIWGSDPVGQLFIKAQLSPDWKKPKPLKDEQGPFLRGAFAAIDEKWGSVDAYLQKEVGVTPADLATLRRTYLQ